MTFQLLQRVTSGHVKVIDLEQVISCSSVSWLINTEPLELLRLLSSELIASESVRGIAQETKAVIKHTGRYYNVRL